MTEGSQASRRQLQPAHWTHRLFVEEPELYLPFLEEAAGRAPAETHALQALFEDACVPPGGRVLDIACGLGRHTVLLAQRGYDVVGVDISPLYVERATEAALNAGVDARFIVGDMLHIERLMEDEAPFNAIISMFTFQRLLRAEGRPGAVWAAPQVGCTGGCACRADRKPGLDGAQHRRTGTRPGWTDTSRSGPAAQFGYFDAGERVELLRRARGVTEGSGSSLIPS